MPDLRGFEPPPESRDARLRPLLIGAGLPDAVLLELADRLGSSEVRLSFTWRLEVVAARVLVTGDALSAAERAWLLSDPLAVSLELAVKVYVGHWDPGLTRWLERGGGQGAHVGASLVAELMRRDETLDRTEIHRLCGMVARLLNEKG